MRDIGTRSVADRIGRRLPAIAFAMAAAALALTTTVVLTRSGPPSAAPVALAERDIAFRDDPDGVVSVLDPRTQAVLARYGRGEGAFVRISVRSLVRQRVASGADMTAPFRLIRGAEGRLALIDPKTGGIIRIGAFGPVATADFAALLPQPEKGV